MDKPCLSREGCTSVFSNAFTPTSVRIDSLLRKKVQTLDFTNEYIPGKSKPKLAVDNNANIMLMKVVMDDPGPGEGEGGGAAGPSLPGAQEDRTAREPVTTDIHIFVVAEIGHR